MASAAAASGLVDGLDRGHDLLRLLAAEAERVGRLGEQCVAFGTLQVVELVSDVAHLLESGLALRVRRVGVVGVHQLVQLFLPDEKVLVGLVNSPLFLRHVRGIRAREDVELVLEAFLSMRPPAGHVVRDLRIALRVPLAHLLEVRAHFGGGGRLAERTSPLGAVGGRLPDRLRRLGLFGKLSFEVLDPRAKAVQVGVMFAGGWHAGAVDALFGGFSHLFCMLVCRFGVA